MALNFSGKKGIDYFECFDQAMELASAAAKQLAVLMNDYTDVAEKANRIHDTEHKADGIFHKMVEELSRAFITPIDREDILQIGSNIDSIIDNIEDIANMMDMFSIKTVREEAKAMTGIIVKACDALEKAVDEFKNFKKSSKNLTKLIIEVNHCEEEGDKFYRKTIKDLYQKEKDPIELAKWKEIFDKMEDTLDTCEDVANLLEGMSIKNS